MKTIRTILLASGIILPLHLSSAQTVAETQPQLQALEQTEPTAAADVPVSGQFYPASLANQGIFAPIFPGNLGHAAWDLGDNVWLVDDLNPTPTVAMKRAMGMDIPSPDPGDDETNDDGGYTNSYSVVMFDTNQLWLEITNVADGWSCLNLHNGTNFVYAIWGTTDLTVPTANWSIEAELFPTVDQTNCLPFTVQTLGRDNLFLRAMDWTGVTHDGNTTPDWWLWEYFGTTALADTNLDSGGVNTLLYDYSNNLDPNVINFTVRLGNQNFNSTTATGSYSVLAGVPSYEAVLVNATNFDDAVWLPYDGNIAMNLGSTDGVYQVQFGLKGRAPDSTPTWLGTEVTLNRSAPQIVITSPTNGIVAQPWLQLQGYTPAPMDKVTYDLNGVTNQLGFITESVLDTNLFKYTTNFFQCYDLLLNEGTNDITLHVADAAGNTSTTNFEVILDYSTATNPAIQVTWPPNGAELACSSFTLRGWTEDAAAQIVATITDNNGDTNTVNGLVERDGKLWVENLPLNSGTNFLTLTVTNTAGFSSATNLMLVKSDMTLALTSITGDLWLPTVSVSGTISDTNAPVWVNGVQGTNNGDGTWNVVNVPVSSGGMASFDVSSSGSLNSTNMVKPDETKLVSGIWHYEDYWYGYDGGDSFEHDVNDWCWSATSGGTGHDQYTDLDYWTSTDYTLGADKSTFAHTSYSNGWSDDTTNSNPAEDDDWLQDSPQESGSITAYGSSPTASWLNQSATVKVEFKAGGQMTAGSQSFYEADGGTTEEVPKLNQVSAAIVDGTNVPMDQVTVSGFGENLDTNGSAFKALPNPPSVEVTLQAPVPRKYFPVAGTRYQLHIFWIGHGDVTDSNQTVIVGEQIGLMCQLRDKNGNPPTTFSITNYLWVVPGYAVSNFYVSSDAFQTNGYPILLTVKTNSEVDYYWADQGSKQVSCTVQVAGQTLAAQTTFNAVRPIGKISAMTSSVELGRDIGNIKYGICFGTNGGEPGILFSNTVTLPSGNYNYGNTNFTVEWVQLISANPSSITESGTNHTIQTSGIVLDTDYPYDENVKTTDDSPNITLEDAGETAAYDAQDSEMWLMFKPSGGGWVPLRTVGWSFSGSASLSETNWTLINRSWSTNPTDTDAGTTYPIWSDNVANTNSFQWIPPF